MSRKHETIWCDGCGVEILWSPIEEAGRDFCCEDCRRGWLCECGDRLEEEDWRARSGTTPAAGGYAGP